MHTRHSDPLVPDPGRRWPWWCRSLAPRTQPAPARTTVAPALETHAAGRERLGQVPRARRQRHRRPRAGRNGRAGVEVARVFPYEFAIMLGDNMYGSERPQDYAQQVRAALQAAARRQDPVLRRARQSRRSEPALLQAVRHGRQALLHLSRKRTSASSRSTATTWTRTSSAWLEKELAQSKSKWKIAYFHHPIYSSGGRHGSEVDLRSIIEPLFIKYGLNVVFAGHEHFYERLKPQNGIYYFTAGGSAKLRAGDIRRRRDDRQGLRYRSELHAGRDRRRRAALPDDLARAAG